MKTKVLIASLFSIIGLLTISCSQSEGVEENASSQTLLAVESDGVSAITRAAISNIFTVTSALNADEIEFLYAVREDEKLAHDVYSVFADKYPTAPQIGRIMNAESTHMAAVDSLFKYYEIDYVPTTEVGVFASPERQEQFNTLSAQSSTLVEAFKTMAFIEEEGIAAYNAVVGDIENVNIKLVIEHLTKASGNHLKAVDRQIKSLGETYTPTVLTQEDYDAIINAPFTHGNAYGQIKGNGGHTNSQKGGKGQGNKGSVNKAGDCTGTTNGQAPGTNSNKGVGKGYHGGK